MSKKPDADVDYKIGQRIRSARIEAAMTQSDLGQALGCSSQQIHKYEHGSNRVSAGTLYAIAQTLGQRVDWFFLDADPSRQLHVNASFSIN